MSSSESVYSMPSDLSAEFLNAEEYRSEYWDSNDTRRKRKRTSVSSQDHSYILRDLPIRKLPNPIGFIPSEPEDNSIASTMTTFTPLTIARIKMQISRIVGQEEIACAE